MVRPYQASHGSIPQVIDETIDISDVVGSFFTIIGKPIQEIGKYKIEDLLALFIRKLHTAPYFLVLDNFEILIDPQANKPQKPGFSDLIEKANEMTGNSRVSFTSLESPAQRRSDIKRYTDSRSRSWKLLALLAALCVRREKVLRTMKRL